MQTAWRERNPEVRIKSACSALDLNPECASAYILLAEEECTSIIEVEKKLKIALKHAETNYRKSQVTQHQSSVMEALHSKSTAFRIFQVCDWSTAKRIDAAKSRLEYLD